MRFVFINFDLPRHDMYEIDIADSDMFLIQEGVADVGGRGFIGC